MNSQSGIKTGSRGRYCLVMLVGGRLVQTAGKIPQTNKYKRLKHWIVSSSQYLNLHFQAKNHKATQGRWPQKSAEFLLQLLKNAESNAEYKVFQYVVTLLYKTRKHKLVYARNDTCPINLGIRYRPFGDRAYTSEQSSQDEEKNVQSSRSHKS